MLSSRFILCLIVLLICTSSILVESNDVSISVSVKMNNNGIHTARPSSNIINNVREMKRKMTPIVDPAPVPVTPPISDIPKENEGELDFAWLSALKTAGGILFKPSCGGCSELCQYDAGDCHCAKDQICMCKTFGKDHCKGLVDPNANKQK